jgi:poly-beta-hydroxyalkanoate depolymerase
VPGGHIGTFVGSKAQKILAPAIVDWIKARI